MLKYLPGNVSDAVLKLGHLNIEEIRLRCEGKSSVTCAGENIALDISLDKHDMQDILLRVSDGSVYSHAETIKQGFITLPCGSRVGICGRAVRENGETSGIYEVASLVFRIPRTVRGTGEYIDYILKRHKYRKGVLIYSPPGEGKTTVLRDVCRILTASPHPMRVVVVDTRDEICRGEEFGTVDVLRGFSRSEGIEIAVRTLSPQLIICDEIGSEADSDAILSLQHCGVPLLASAHASSVDDLLSRPCTARLDAAGVFAGYVGISRCDGEVNYNYTPSRRQPYGTGT